MNARRRCWARTKGHCGERCDLERDHAGQHEIAGWSGGIITSKRKWGAGGPSLDDLADPAKRTTLLLDAYARGDDT